MSEGTPVADGATLAPLHADGRPDDDVAAVGPAMSARAAYRFAAIVTVPYLLLMFAWAMSNPPGAAPDEPDHLVKAIGVAALHIGKPAPLDRAPGARPLAIRNASISRIVPVPADLVPNGYNCTAFKQTLSAACLPDHHRHGTRDIPVSTPIGSYPPFLYLPIGLAARLAHSPVGAFTAGRLVCVAMASILILLGMAVLVRWLGRRALIGGFIGLTPMTLFASSMVSTSGAEIMGGFATACVGVVVIRRPDALRSPMLMYTLAVVGSALILSRQLGSVTFGAVVVLALIRVGWRAVWNLVRERNVAFLVSVGILVVSAALLVYWERRYDHPALTGGPFADGAYSFFITHAFGYVRGGVGLFGWLDTLVPQWILFSWITLAVVLVGLAVLLGRTRDRWTLIAWMVLLVLVAYVTFVTVFFPILANLQSRHMLPLFQFLPLFAGVVLVDTVDPAVPGALRRVLRLSALVMPAIQFGGLYINARRYAVGVDGPLWFFGKAEWSPRGGFVPWLLVGLVGSALLAFVMLRTDVLHRKELAHVEG